MIYFHLSLFEQSYDSTLSYLFRSLCCRIIIAFYFCPAMTQLLELNSLVGVLNMIVQGDNFNCDMSVPKNLLPHS